MEVRNESKSDLSSSLKLALVDANEKLTFFKPESERDGVVGIHRDFLFFSASI